MPWESQRPVGYLCWKGNNISKCVLSHATAKYSGKTEKICPGTHCFVVLHRIDDIILSNIPKKAHWKTLLSQFVWPVPMQSCRQTWNFQPVGTGVHQAHLILKNIFSVSKLISSFLILCVLIVIGSSSFLWDFVCLVFVRFWLRFFVRLVFWCFRHFQMEFATTFI